MNKKITALILAGVMTCSLCACSGNTDNNTAPDAQTTEAVPEETVGLANPITEYASLDEINNLTGGNLCLPETMSVTDETFAVIPGETPIAQYTFTENGISWNFRFSSDYSTDISGIYGDNGDTIFTGTTIGETSVVEGSDYKSACFFTTDGMYVLTADDNGAMTADEFKSRADEISELVKREDSDEVVSLYTEYASLEEINELTGANLCRPAVMGVEDTGYYVIDTEPAIAEFDFTVNGVPYVFRFSSDFTTDISGIYGEDGNTIFTGAEIGSTTVIEGDDYKSACFFTTDGQYVLTVNDEGTMDSDTFTGVVLEMMNLVTRQDSDGADLSAYEGSWHESTAGRGTIEITADGDELTFSVRWPNSAAEVYETSFSGTPENGTVTYTNGTATAYTYDENGNVTEENSVYTDGTGTVTFNEDGSFTWIQDGFDDEGSVFVKD